MSSESSHESAASLWSTFIERRLLIKGYDSVLFEHVKDRLNLDCTFDDCSATLERSGITATRLVDTLLECMRPFMQMVTDLLELYSSVGAKSGTGESPRITYDFDSDKPWNFFVIRV